MLSKPQALPPLVHVTSSAAFAANAADGVAATTPTLTTERNVASDAVLRAAATQQAAATTSQQDAIATMLAAIGTARRLGMFTSASAIGVGLVLAYLIGRSIAGPIGRLTGVMRELAGGALEVVVPHGDRRDELGAMARAVGVFQDNMRKVAQLTQQQESERTQAEGPYLSDFIREATHSGPALSHPNPPQPRAPHRKCAAASASRAPSR